MRKDVGIRAAAAAVGAAGLWFAWAQTQPAQPLTMQKVSENLYVIIGEAYSNPEMSLKVKFDSNAG